MWRYEKDCWSRGFKRVAGVDEAGRGPLAGPVFAASVVFPEGAALANIRDSKKVTPKGRERLFQEICAGALTYSIGIATEDEIDAVNILQASFLAMRRALKGLNVKPDMILVDGNFTIPGTLYENQKAIVQGDNKSASIAAASILAKVARDYYMLALDREFPHYGFKKHKGYGTPLHLEKLKQFGPSPAHRMSFSPCMMNRGQRAAGSVHKAGSDPVLRMPV